MNPYFLPLNIDKREIFNTSWKRPIGHKVQWKEVDYVKDMLTPYFFNKLQSVAQITGTMIFNKINHQNPDNAHIDIAMVNNKIQYIPYGLNIVFDDSTDITSTMRWYSHKKPIDKVEVLYSLAGTAYISYPVEELVLEEEHNIDNLVTLVRTNVPHAISSGNRFRTCISIRFKYPDNEWYNGYKLFDKLFNQ